MNDTLHPLGTFDNTRWLAGPAQIDMAAPGPAPKPVALAATPQSVTFDL